jgi:hypothetical protein
MAIQEDSDIDEWFNERKEALTERMLAELEKGVDSSTAQQRFDVAFRRLLAEYESRYRSTTAKRRRQERIGRPLQRLRAWREGRALAFSLWRKRIAQSWRRRRFEREYAHLFKK